MDQHLRSSLVALGTSMLREAPDLNVDDILAPSLDHLEVVRRGRPFLVFGGIAVASFFAGVGTVAAVSALTSHDVERGLPGAAHMFDGTNPTCESLGDEMFLCSLETPPEFDTPPPGEELNVAGISQPVVDGNSRIAGACVALNQDAAEWLCVTGERAGAYGLLRPDQLGALAEPSNG